MERDSLEEIRGRFNSSLEQMFGKLREHLLHSHDQEKINDFYLFVRYQLPVELHNAFELVVEDYRQTISTTIGELAEDKASEHNLQIVDKLYLRINQPPLLEQTNLGPNNTFNQAFGMFSLTGGGLYLFSSFIPVHGGGFYLLRVTLSLILGLYLARLTYRQYEEKYRNDMLKEGHNYLETNHKLLHEWFDQIVAFCEGERDLSFL